jgi:hypothetical protein
MRILRHIQSLSELSKEVWIRIRSDAQSGAIVPLTCDQFHQLEYIILNILNSLINYRHNDNMFFNILRRVQKLFKCLWVVPSLCYSTDKQRKRSCLIHLCVIQLCVIGLRFGTGETAVAVAVSSRPHTLPPRNLNPGRGAAVLWFRVVPLTICHPKVHTGEVQVLFADRVQIARPIYSETIPSSSAQP